MSEAKDTSDIHVRNITIKDYVIVVMKKYTCGLI